MLGYDFCGTYTEFFLYYDAMLNIFPHCLKEDNSIIIVFVLCSFIDVEMLPINHILLFLFFGAPIFSRSQSI